ncbi:MAG: hypothetical protein KDA60_12860, partial [Planctomycetales bacterium]|nr:hypothetical protein [Planctomycetales bacterium]
MLRTQSNSGGVGLGPSVWLLLALLLLPGCASARWAQMRKAPSNPLSHTLQLDSRKGPQPTQQTLQMLRRFDLLDMMDGDPEQLVTAVQAVANSEPTADHVYAVAELAYIGAKQLEDRTEDLALDLYGIAVGNAYFYLFDERYDSGRNPYDPRFRRACDLYNGALESALRIVQRRGMLVPGGTFTVNTARQRFDMTVAPHGSWHSESIAELKFVSDFEVKELTNRYRTFGLGVPMIAVHKNVNDGSPAEQFYPPGMSYPVTAFLRVTPNPHAASDPYAQRHLCTVELHDPLRGQDITVNQRLVPLETDITTPLAYSLDNPVFKKANEPTRSLISPSDQGDGRGLYMLQPYDPGKIPVVMVHGFWSSLVTWMEMFNDLRGSPAILDNYQFWFYLYPTGEPFWYTAQHLRRELEKTRGLPQGSERPLDKMILVGHSMGGLISVMQTIDSGEQFWALASDKPFQDLHADAELSRRIQE